MAFSEFLYMSSAVNVYAFAQQTHLHCAMSMVDSYLKYFYTRFNSKINMAFID